MKDSVPVVPTADSACSVIQPRQPARIDLGWVLLAVQLLNACGAWCVQLKEVRPLLVKMLSVGPLALAVVASLIVLLAFSATPPLNSVNPLSP